MLAPVLAQLHEKFPQDVRVIFRHFPLNGHEKSLITAQAAEAAGLQGKFWEMHDLLFAKQGDWVPMTADQFGPWLTEQAKSLGLDLDKFNADLNSDEIVQKVKKAQVDGEQLQIPGTPLVLINGEIYDGPRDLENLSAIVKVIPLEDRQFTECPPMTIDAAKKYEATLKTSKGDIVIQLFADKAPITVNSFIFLAKNGWFDNIPFHRVIPGFVAQTGDPSGTGLGNPGYAFVNEISDLKYDKPGMVGMANAGADTNGSQFFITYAPLPDLNAGYTIFGEVISGMDVAEKLTARNAQEGGILPDPDTILSVTITEK